MINHFHEDIANADPYPIKGLNTYNAIGHHRSSQKVTMEGKKRRMTLVYSNNYNYLKKIQKTYQCFDIGS